MFGYMAAELIGRNVSRLMPSPYREAHNGYLARYRRSRMPHIIGIGRELEAVRKDGTVFPVDLAVSEIEAGRFFTGIIRDLSDRKLSESRLREADRMASIGALAAGLGHDMNNVLLPVRAHLNALKADADVARNRRDHLDRIQQSIAYLQQLADGLHYLAMDPEKGDDAAESTDLRTWWSQTGALLSKAVPKHVKVTTLLPDGLPRVAVAAHALTQAVLNLIVNAGEAIPPGRKRRQGMVRLWAEADPVTPLVRLGVTDNGSGMTEEVRRRAFDMFFTTKPRGLGTGLGLAMVRKFIDGAGGAARIDSAPGRGTTVVLSLPVAATSGNGAARVVPAAVCIRDGRAASMVRTLLEGAGIRPNADSDPGRADLLIVEPVPAGLSMARAWRAAKPRGGLILFGRPDRRTSAAWMDLNPVTIGDPDDLDAVRAGLGAALAGP
jgi:PAS domain S-box-containing protein